MNTREIKISEYNYNLPEEKIAFYPLEKRDQSKLLIRQNKEISEDIFTNIDHHLPEGARLYFNNTKVVRARLIFKKPTGARIELFVLEPVSPVTEIQQAFQITGTAEWKCFIGNAKKWKNDALEMEFEHDGIKYHLKAEKGEKIDNAFLVKFSWSPEEITFAELLEEIGKIPLPPYINREAGESDTQRYQTIYALHDGSVAAPTAGLHFTESVFEKLSKKNISNGFVTLHVGAGTFKPVDAEMIGDHNMHHEQILVDRQTIQELIKRDFTHLIAVGTTSVRTLESLYWIGLKLIHNPNIEQPEVEQWDPYTLDDKASINQALEAILKYLDRIQSDFLYSSTQLMIAPGYKFRVVEGIITNFHQPQSTLLLLVSAFMGDAWKEVYNYALNNDFRFLSYGDSCLFL